jgi:AraC family transcriptional regulator
MLKPYDLLNNVLDEIESKLKDDIDCNYLADKFSISSSHLRRLFKIAFKQSIGTYIRSRKLAASIGDLLKTDQNILDIALDYGFEYEQSYIRAFKSEFGLTPGDLRKTGQFIQINPPLHLFNSNKIEDGVLLGPDLVMIPQFHLIGKMHKVTFRDDLVETPKIANYFAYNERHLISDIINPKCHINLCRTAITDDEHHPDYSLFMPSSPVKNLSNIPQGFDYYTFSSSLCVRFCFISPIDSEVNMAVADALFKAIDDFMDDKEQKYFLERKRLNFERFAFSAPGDLYKQWEWYAPVIIKTENESQKIPSGIIKTYKQKISSLRFIGKKYKESIADFNYKKILVNMDTCRLNSEFDLLEKQTTLDLKKLYEGGNADISLIKYNDEDVEYWLGIFMPEGTKVPSELCRQGYEAIDFPKSTLGVCTVYGKRDVIINYYNECKKIFSVSEKWFFQRFNWHKFYEEDKFGNRLLDYCYIL